MSVPEGETKSVTDFGVFAFTAVFSLWAYLWMLIVYIVWTPDQVTIVEALLTLSFLPIMVFAAYKINTWGVTEAPEISSGEGNGDEDGCDTSTFVMLFCSRGKSTFQIKVPRAHVPRHIAHSCIVTGSLQCSMHPTGV